jgi:hypothetical protein
MSAYYTKNDETPMVFHVWNNCPEGEQIEDANKVTVMTDRVFCRSCAAMNYKSS